MNRKNSPTLKIEDCWLYAVSSISDLARRLSTKRMPVTTGDLKSFAVDNGNFKLFVAKMGNGKERPIQEPKPRLQKIHARIHKLLGRVVVPPYLHSAVRGRSYLSNAGAHPSNVPIIKIDIRKFFASVPKGAVFVFFSKTMKCRRDVAGLLSDLLTFNGRLATGSSASPIIAYYAFKPMFDEIERFAKERGLVMTCYVDDITLSGTSATKSSLHQVRQIIARYGLQSHKTRNFKASDPKVVTGICITCDGSKVPNKLHLKIKRGFDDLKKSESPEEIEKKSRPLLGRLEAAGLIDPKFKARAVTLRSKIRTAAARISQA